MKAYDGVMEITSVPAGAWAVGVSGGADSVALLLMLVGRGDLRVHGIHLDHETRGGESAGDARFVGELCGRVRVGCTIARRGEVERGMGRLPGNRSARFRAVRFELFKRVCAEHGLAGVILAHHADDQAETVFQRLLKGSAPAGLMGMRGDSLVAGVRVLRPLLGMRGAELREWLKERGQDWREDASNASRVYQRNRVRGVLRAREGLGEALRGMAGAMRGLVEWARGASPMLGESFAVSELGGLPDVVAAEAARRWLVGRGALASELSPGVLGRLVEMARDAASAARGDFPGGVVVRRRRGRISAG